MSCRLQRSPTNYGLLKLAGVVPGRRRLLGHGDGILAVRDGGLDGALQLLHGALLRRRGHLHRPADGEVPAVRRRHAQRRRRGRQLPTPPPPPLPLPHLPSGARTVARERVRPAPLLPPLPLRLMPGEGGAQLLHHGRHVSLHPLAHVQRPLLGPIFPLLLGLLLSGHVAAAALLPPRAAKAGEERRGLVLGPTTIPVHVLDASDAVARGDVMMARSGVAEVAEVAADAADGGAGHGERVQVAAEGRGEGEVVVGEGGGGGGDGRRWGRGRRWVWLGQ